MQGVDGLRKRVGGVNAPCNGSGEVGELGTVETVHLVGTAGEQYDGQVLLVELGRAGGDVAQGVVGGLVVGRDEANDAQALARQQCGFAAGVQVKVTAGGVDAAQNMHQCGFVAQIEVDFGIGNFVGIDGEAGGMSQYAAVAQAVASGKQIGASLEYRALAESVAPGGIFGVGEQLRRTVDDTAQGEMGVVGEVGAFLIGCEFESENAVFCRFAE